MDKQDLWEKEMEDMIRETGEKLSVPESLRPENIRENLLEKKKLIRMGRIRKIQRFCAIAAVFMVFCGCGIAWLISNGEPTFPGEENKIEDSWAGKGVDIDKEATSGIVKEKQDESVEVEKLNYAKSYKEVRAALQEIEDRWAVKEKDAAATRGIYNGAIAEAEDREDTLVVSADIGAVSHSETNVSVEGMMEADQLITDGEYIYRLREKEGEKGGILDIIKVDGATMELTGKYECDGSYPREFFLADEQLILLSYVERQGEVNTSITFIDISDRKKPVKTQELIQSGIYKEARLQDGYLYTVSGNSLYLGHYDCVYEGDVATKGKKDLIPCLNGKRISADRIYIPDACNEEAFTTITSVKLDNPKDFTDARSVMSGIDTLHMTKENIYFTTQRWVGSMGKRGSLTKTQLTKFSYKDGKFIGKASKKIQGLIRDTFAINEYQGNLRVISSISYNTGKPDNAVYVLDEELNIIGKIENLAEDERVYSARFQGDIGYFVTYRETDPLFSVDFSDPHNPKILGELKIPGFSEYMHFYNEHLLLGIGVEEGKDKEQPKVKLSMFDISDPKNVREIHKTLLNKIDYSQALYDYKAVMIDPEKNIIGFNGWDNYSDDYSDDLANYYFVYTYDEEKGFVRKMRMELGNERYDARGLYIGDTVYLVHMEAKAIQAYDWNSGKCIGSYQG